MEFLIKCPVDVGEDTEIVTFDVISLHTCIPNKFGIEALDYFLTMYKEVLHLRFKKQFFLESAKPYLLNQHVYI